jgi:hypothetical protein
MRNKVKLDLMSNPAFQHAKTFGGSRAKEGAREKFLVENSV